MDLRVKRTYKMLNDAFTELMGERSYEDISVAMLCERAMIRRTTFYKHFADKNDYFLFYIKSIRDEFRDRLGIKIETDVQAQVSLMLQELMAFLDEHHMMVENAMKSSSMPLLLETLGLVICSDLEKTALKDPCVAASGVDPHVLAAFLSGGTIQLAHQWLTEGRPADSFEKMNKVLLGVTSSFNSK